LPQGSGGLLEIFLEFLIRLFELLLGQLGAPISGNFPPSPSPSTAPCPIPTVAENTPIITPDVTQMPSIAPIVSTVLPPQTEKIPQPVGPVGNWKLIFNDEFTANSLDLSKWIMCNPSFASSCNPWNNEQEKFNFAPTGNNNIVVSNGALHLITTKATGQIYSGMVSTGPDKFGYKQPGYKSFQYTYGLYEGRIKVPKGNGFWPSMWMLPDQTTYGAWPGSGEYDVFEIAGNNPSIVHMSEHDGQNGGTGDSVTKQTVDLSADYHVYGFDWEPDHLAWYLDGQLSRSMICTEAYATAHPGVCDAYRNVAAIKNYPFYIIANFSVGGSWPPLNGAPDGNTPFPSSMDIDWIRVWQH
jgi:beta-glucanase (GH16 family)